MIKIAHDLLGTERENRRTSGDNVSSCEQSVKVVYESVWKLLAIKHRQAIRWEIVSVLQKNRAKCRG